MLTSVTGIYQDGNIKLTEHPANISEGTKVIVTFISSNEIDLLSQGINPEEAAKLRESLSPFAEDWDSPEMNLYDNYDNNKSKLETR